MIEIAFNIDKNYINQCKTVLNSILANTKSKVHFNIIGLDKFENYTCFGVPDVSIIKRNTNYRHITTSACYRLFLPDILPYKKVIYLDCDLIVLDDIKKLWNYDVDLIAGVQDHLFIHHAKKNNLKHCYINSGVLLINLENMRNIDYKKRIIEAQNPKYNLSLLDQDIINIAFGEEIQHLPEQWNVYGTIYKQTTNEMLSARLNPSIIHWCGENKPFNSNLVWKYELWRKYAIM